MAFSIAESPTTVQGDYNPLPAAGIQMTYPASQQFGFLRLGVGGHKSFLGDAQINLIRQSKQTLDFSFNHRSVFGDITNSADETQRAYSNKNNLAASYKRYQENTELSASFTETYNAWNYFGSWGTTGSTANLVVPDGQWSSDTRLGFALKSRDQGQPLSWNVDAASHIYRLGRGVLAAGSTDEEKGGREKEISIKANINYDRSDLFHYGIDAKLRSFSYHTPKSINASDENFGDRGWFEFTPYARMIYKQWVVMGGIRLAIPTLETERVKANIVASASRMLDEQTSVNVTLGGGVNPLSYREGIGMNPYLDPATRLKSTWKVIDLTAGIDFRPYRNLRLSPVFEYDVTKNAPFFHNGNAGSLLNDAYLSYGQLFSAEYMTSNHFKVGASGLYTYGSLLTVLGELNYNQYLNYSENDEVDNLLKDNGRKAWYKPGLEMRLRADISATEKLNLFVDYRMEALRYAADNTSFCRKMDGINNLTIGGNYKLIKDVDIFLHLNNLLDERTEIWYAYPVHGFTAVIGGSVNF